MRRFRLTCVLLVLALAACQGGEQPPIASGAKPSSTPALTPPDSLGILVLPVAGAPSPAADDIAQAMTSALQEADVPASTGSSHRRRFRPPRPASALQTR